MRCLVSHTVFTCVSNPPQVQEELDNKRVDEVSGLQELVTEKEGNIEQMTVQIQTLQGEVDNLTDFQVSSHTHSQITRSPKPTHRHGMKISNSNFCFPLLRVYHQK